MSEMRKLRLEQLKNKDSKEDTGLLKIGPKHKAGNRVVTEERLEAILPELEQYYELWLSYPDKLVDILLPEDTTFRLFPFQKVSLRVNARHHRVAQTATRGYSKSFIAVLGKMLKCVLLPGTKETMVAEHKVQTAQIGREKVNELFGLMPLLKEEVNFKKGSQTSMSTDGVRLVYKNTAEFDIVGIRDSTRGGRRNGLLAEEFKDLPSKEMNEVVLPLLNISRRMTTGELNPNEIHQQQTFVGSAGYKNSYAYDKVIEILVDSVLNPDKAFCWGGSYVVPMYHGLLNQDFVDGLRRSETYDEDSFAREFLSKWSSTAEGSLFDFEKLQGLRKIKRAEWKARNDEDVFYVLSVDVARNSARTVAEIFKIRRGKDYFTKDVVNIITMAGRNFLYQAAKIKELDSAFDFHTVVIDANGLGVGLMDFLMTENVEATTGITYPSWNIQNISEYKQYAIDQKVGAPAKIHVIKTNQHSAGNIHSNAYNELFSGRVRLLIDEKAAKSALLDLQKGRRMGLQERLRHLEPYKNTTLLINETSNLKINRNHTYLKLDMIQTNAEKDTFSALEYGLWVISSMESEHYASMRTRRSRWSNMMFYN